MSSSGPLTYSDCSHIRATRQKRLNEILGWVISNNMPAVSSVSMPGSAKTIFVQEDNPHQISAELAEWYEKL